MKLAYLSDFHEFSLDHQPAQAKLSYDSSCSFYSGPSLPMDPGPFTQIGSLAILICKSKLLRSIGRVGKHLSGDALLWS